MKRETFIAKMEQFGDAVITYKSRESNKTKYVVATSDLNNAYIQDKLKRLNMRAIPQDTILVFCWDADAFKSIDPSIVVSLEPLSNILQNVSP